MTLSSQRILNPPTPDILNDSNSLYRLLLELYYRTGGFEQATVDLKGLTATVAELNTLDGVNTDQTVQNQLNSKAATSSLKTMAFQDSSNVSITGGVVTSTNLNGCNATNLNATGGIFNGITATTVTGSSAIATSGGTIHTDFTLANSLGMVETNLLSFGLTANTLGTDNSYIEVIGFGYFAGNANNKTLKLKLGTTTLYNSTSLALNGGAWKLHAIISRISASVEKSIIEISSGNALLPNSVTYIQTAENLATNLNIVFTGLGVSDNDILQQGLIIKYYKG